jgi:hypothetical protein
MTHNDAPLPGIGLLARIQAVIRLHRECDCYQHSDHPCHACEECGRHWPCPTIRTLQGTTERNTQ